MRLLEFFSRILYMINDPTFYDKTGKTLYVKNGIEKKIYDYDKMGKLVRIRLNKKPQILNIISSFSYNEKGLVLKENLNLKRILFSYDSVGKLISRQMEEKHFDASCNCSIWKKGSIITLCIRFISRVIRFRIWCVITSMLTFSILKLFGFTNLP